ncbi:antibiotic ABC transporter ATP-binding protein [Finegoldia magna]|uniref:ABC transporter ATP-binding protein n=1 Tax=Finegoldia magna TaxID=1260 RepID=UPI000B916FFB|nr:ABC transporter ATP-binding protein [Finegoldia magna]OXZ32100.1 antibiotic ABC transporter ATP-binding protein [Finegoldia magna]
MYIQFNNIKKSFDGNTVLDVENLQIEKGEIVSIIGKNGSGKSTLIKILCGLLYQDQGECRVDNISNKNSKIREHTKLVLESGGGYYDYLTAAENIMYFLGLNHVNYNENEVHNLMSKLDFTEFKDKKVSELSQGNRQKLSLIVTLLTNPDIICLDEPTNGLDINSMNILLNFLHKIAVEDQKTVIFTSHDLSFMKNINSRLILINEGKIVLDKPSKQLFDSKDLQKDIIEIENTNRNLLDNLKKTKYEFTDNSIILSVYDEDEKEFLLKNCDIISMRKESLTAEDVYFRVISNV